MLGPKRAARTGVRRKLEGKIAAAAAGRHDGRPVQCGRQDDDGAIAATRGSAYALGRVPLIEPELRSGRLVPLVPGLQRDASWRFVLRRHPSTRHRLLDPLIAFLRREADAPPFVAKIVAPASNDSHARGAGGA